MVEKESETKKKLAISEAEKNAGVSKILMEQKLMEKESSRKQQEIENLMYLDRQKSLTDANFYQWLCSHSLYSQNFAHGVQFQLEHWLIT